MTVRYMDCSQLTRFILKTKKYRYTYRTTYKAVKMKVQLLLVVFNVMFHLASVVGKKPECSNLSLLEELLQRMECLEFEMDRLKQPQIAFSAGSPSKLQPDYNQIIIFQNVTLNEGSAYNPQSGIFIAPVDGLYHFTAHVCNEFEYAVVVAIIHNGNVQALSTQFEDKYGGCVSVSALIRINAGDSVFVINSFKKSFLREDKYRRNSFTGFRLN